MNNIPNDIPKYRKKSTARPPAKAKHKHVYEPCLLEIPEEWWNKPHERSGKTTIHFATYCPVCGKTGSAEYKGLYPFFEREYTEEEKRELDPMTRTLPLFKTDEWRPKFVEIEKE